MRLPTRLVLLVLLLQATVTVTLWTLNPTDLASQGIFAALLGVDLLGFAMVSYLYRREKTGIETNRPWVLVGCGVFVILLLAALLVA